MMLPTLIRHVLLAAKRRWQGEAFASRIYSGGGAHARDTPADHQADRRSCTARREASRSLALINMAQAAPQLMLALCGAIPLIRFVLSRAVAKSRDGSHILDPERQPLLSMSSTPASLKGATRRIVQSTRRCSARFLIAAAALGVAFIGLNFGDSWQRASIAETQAHAVETFSLSSVAGSVPGREAARKAQAAAIMEAQRMGLDVAIASVGSGGKRSGDSAADEQAFARLAQRFPETLKAVEEGDPFRERLSKTWIAGAKALADARAPNGISQIISEAKGQVGACVVEMHASGESLREMLIMAYAESAIDAIERKARSLGISAADVAFLVSAHESAHCVIGMARRAELFDTSWADPHWKVPSSWGEARFEDDLDSPALAKAEESTADMLAVLWAADVLGARKAKQLGRLAIYARSRGARSSNNDGLHDSSRVLAKILAPRESDRYFSADNRARLAWNTASLQTQGEVFERAAP